jgi:hypothetical protein
MQILRMASGATKMEALLSQLNKGRTTVARGSGGNSGGNGGGSSGEGGSGGSNPPAAGTAEAVTLAAAPIDRAASCPVSSWGQQLLSSAANQAELKGSPVAEGANIYASFSASESTLQQVQPRIPSEVSVDGADMYGMYEDAACSPTAGDAGTIGDAVVVAASHYSASSGGSTTAAAYPSPFAAAADQRQEQGQGEWRAAHETIKAQQSADTARNTAHGRPPLSDSEPNDSASVRHGNLDAKGQDSAVEGPAADTRHVC